MSETSMRRRLGEMLGGYHFTPVENGKTCEGTPDGWWVDYGGGAWAELKEMDRWPKDERDQLRIKHYTAAQRDWLQQCLKTGGRPWLIVKVREEWLLFNRHEDFQLVGHLTRE